MYSRVWLLSVLTLAGCSGAGAEQTESAKKECVDFYKGERGQPMHVYEAKDTWEKDGRLVVEIADKESESADSWNIGLCVVDLERGQMELPAAYSQSRWER